MHAKPFDPRRRALLRNGLAGGSALLLPPWLASCGNSSSQAVVSPGPVPPPAAAKFAPRGRHVSWTGDIYTSRTVTWFTDGSEVPAQTLEYGPVLAGMSAADIANAPFTEKVAAATTTTPFVDALTHKATADQFDEALPIRYRVGSAQGHSPVAVLRPTPRGAFRFAHFGDHGRTAGSRAVARAIRARQPDFTLLAGDLCYASGSDDLGPQEVWDDWFNQIDADLGSDTVWMTAPGNHENEGNNGVAYRNRLATPTSALSPDGTFYTFDYGNVHFVISTGGAFATDGTLAQEIAFLETDLAAAALRRAAGQIDFIVVCQHFTIWTDQEGRGPANLTLVALQEGIFVRYGVDLLAVGHDHIYQRSAPMAFGLRNPLGYVQVTSGCGGVGIRGFEPTIQGWSEKHLAQLLFVEYTVNGASMTATTYGVDETTGLTSVVDEFTIARRSSLAAHLAVQPVRELALLGKAIDGDFDRLAKRTAARNHRLCKTHHA
ncbi:MAG: metallophosphoesterase [Stagnimonas sp.]|nr:metallophosphoesterase [Stagnimonas sp.]